jgi:hypothetical protein
MLSDVPRHGPVNLMLIPEGHCYLLSPVNPTLIIEEASLTLLGILLLRTLYSWIVRKEFDMLALMPISLG